MTVQILTGDCREMLSTLDDDSVQTCVTSPPYFGLRDYGVSGQIGLESSLDAYVTELVAVFREVRRVLHDTGTLWLNLGDSYAGSATLGRNDGGRNFTGGGGNHIGSGNPGRQGTHERITGAKPKDLLGVPWRVAFALQADGWYLRSDIVWHKPNPMPESVRDRPTSAHEHIFLLTKQARYFYDADAIRQPLKDSSLDRLSQPTLDMQAGSLRANGGMKTNGTMKAVRRSDKQRGHSRRHAGFNDRWDAMTREEQRANGANARNVWTIPTKGYKGAHFAVMPTEVVRRCILAGSREGDTVLDPFGGAGTVGLVADRLDRDAILIELNPDYAEMARHRIDQDAPLFAPTNLARPRKSWPTWPDDQLSFLEVAP